MGKTSEKFKKIPKALIAFLVIALLFLAVGLGTLGSPSEGVGKAYELKTKRDDGDPPSVVMQLTFSDSENFKETYTDENGKEQTRTFTLKVSAIYVNLAVIYAEPGEPATLRLEYASSGSQSSFGLQSRRADAVFENLYTNAPAEGEEAVEPTVTDGQFRWVAPFQSVFEKNNWTTSYRYVRLTALTHDVLINEVVFVGEKQVNSEGTGETMVIPAKIYSATPYNNETQEEANLRAEALLDAQYLPSTVQSSYYLYSDDELYTLSTIAEMRRGGEYDSAIPSAAYRVEGVYNSLGTGIIALGTKIFGLTPFGLRFFSMLASFGVLIFGYLFVRQLTKSDFAGLIFSLIYVFCNLSFALGHLGNPLMIGIFFFMGALYFCHKFYARGMKSARGASVLTPVFAALFAAAAITVNGAYLIPVAGLAALFVCGMVRQQKAKKHYLALAASEETDAEDPAAAREQATAAVKREYREKNLAAALGFGVTLIAAAVLFALLFAIPLYGPYMRLYSSGGSIFVLAWHAFAGGFAGSNPGATHAAWDLFYDIFAGTGTTYAVTAAAVNAVAAVAGILGVIFAVWRILAVILSKKLEKQQRGELRRVLVPLVGLILSLIMTAFGGGALGFILLAYVFAFVLAAEGVAYLWGSKYGKAAKAVSIVGLILLIAVFALYFVFTFSIPLPASLIGKILG